MQRARRTIRGALSARRHAALFAIGSALTAALLGSCSSGTPPSEPPASGAFQPPPRPGSSITHTKLCECKTCAEAACCNGDVDESSNETSDGGLGLSVASCGRCLRQVYRVALVDSCEERAPHECCPESAR